MSGSMLALAWRLCWCEQVTKTNFFFGRLFLGGATVTWAVVAVADPYTHLVLSVILTLVWIPNNPPPPSLTHKHSVLVCYATGTTQAAASNAIGAFVLSLGWGVHGLRYEWWKQSSWVHDQNSSETWLITTGAIRAAFDVSCLGCVLRVAPFGLGPAICVTLLY